MFESVRLRRLRAAREKARLSQGTLAGVAGIHLQTICNAERGLSVKVNTAEKIARALGVELEALK